MAPLTPPNFWGGPHMIGLVVFFLALERCVFHAQSKFLIDPLEQSQPGLSFSSSLFQ